MPEPTHTNRPEAASTQEAEAGPRPIRVLLVEDDDDDYILTRDLLSEVQDGYALERVATYADGLVAMRQNRHDVYLLDYRLGEHTGVELMREAVAHGCQGPVVLLTGQGERAVDLEAMKAGAEDFLAKERIDAPLLERSLRYALERWRDRQALRQAQADLEHRVEERTAELARANAALRTSEERLRLALQAGHMGTWEWTIPDNRVTWSAAVEAIHGLDPGTFPGTFEAYQQGIYPADRDFVLASIKQAVEQGTDHHLEYRIVWPDGSVHWVEARGRLYRDERGTPQRMTGVCLNVDERKVAEEEVRFQAHLLNAVGQAAIATDPQGKIIYWNRFAETLYGWPREEVLGRNILDVTPAPVSKQQAAEIMERLVAGETTSREFLVRRRDGTIFPAFVTDTPILDDQGKVKSIIGISTDISERKRVEQALQFLADASAVLAVVEDFESTLQKVVELAVPHFADWCAVDIVEENGTLRRLAVTHLDAAKMELAHELDQRYPPDPASQHGVPQVVRTGRSDIMSDIPDALIMQAARDEGHLHLLRDLGFKSYMCVPLQGQGRLLGVVSFVSAESGRHYTEADLAFAEELARRAGIALENARLYAELREANRLKDEFLAMLAHELRNPLAPIRNALHILKQPAVSRAMIAQVRDMAERQVQHMARLLDDLLDVSRISRGKIELRKEAVNLADVVSRTAEGVRPLMEQRHHELTLSLPQKPIRVAADPTRLEQVLTNLLNNAAKYTDPGGHIWLTVERNGEQVVVRVRDTGIGIAREMLPRIFDLFVQAERRLDRSQGGVGIGLTLVKKLVELHGGSIVATSPGLGQGSEFVLRLPALAAGPGDTAGKEQPAERPSALPAHRVLVVDDNVDAADSLALLLRLVGQEVKVAHNGATALRLAEAFSPQVVFLDIGMPGMDGYEVCRKLRQQPGTARAVVIAVSGWGQDEDRRRSKESGFDQHLVKPVEPEMLRQILVQDRPAEPNAS